MGLGMGWVGLDLCEGLLYEHRFAMLIITPLISTLMAVLNSVFKNNV